MNRAERRRKDRQDKKIIKQEGDTQSFQMEMEFNYIHWVSSIF